MMRIEEQIVEVYVRYVKGWFTMSNIKCKHNKEIDLLAVDLDRNKYHIETTIYLDNWPLEIDERGRKDVVTIEWYANYKFLDEFVMEKVKEILKVSKLSDYKRILVYWMIKKGLSREEIQREAKKYHIDDVWLLPDIINELYNALEDGYIKDNVDILRAIRIVRRSVEKR